MQAVILVGGLGTRLGPLTAQMPKCMVLVNGKPFLFYLLELLKSNNISDIILCTGYLGEQVSDYFGDGKEFGVSIRYSRETEKLLGTAGAIKKAEMMLADHFFTINGDTYLPIDYVNLENYYHSYGDRDVMVVYRNEKDTGVRSNVKLADGLAICQYAKGVDDPDLEYVDAGVLVLNRGILATIDQEVPCSLEEAVYQPLINSREMIACVTRTRFYDIGTPEQLNTFADFLKRHA